MNAETAEQPVVDPARASVLVARDTDAEFVDFVTSAGPYLYRTAYLLSGDAHQAEELVQATFERTYRAWAKARVGEPRAYARRILMNLRIDGWRKDRRSAVTDDGVVPLSPLPDHADDVAVRDELGRALRSLPLGQRRVVVLRHLLDLSEAQVADELGISAGTVKSTNSRGLARLRSLLSASAIDAVPEFRADGGQVLRQARAAARRRRVIQAVVTVAGVFVLVLGLLLAGPVRMPGLGPVVLPGSEWLRTVLGLDGRGISALPLDHTDTAACTRPDDEAPTTSVDTMSAGWGSLTVVGVIDTADAHDVERCVDVVVDHRWTTAARVEADAPTLGAGESVLHWSDPDPALDGDLIPGPSTLEALAPDGEGWRDVVPVAETEQVDGRWPQALGLARHGDRAAWFETPNTQILGTLPWTLRLLDEEGRVTTVSDSSALKVAEAGTAALADTLLGWTTTPNVARTRCNQTLHTAALDGSVPVRTGVRERVCALGSTPDGLLVAYEEGSGGPASGAGSGTTTVFELLSGPGDVEPETLLSIRNQDIGYEAVSALGYDARRLVFAAGDLLYLVDVSTLTTYHVEGASPVVALDVSAGTVAWSTEDGAAYAMVDRDGAPSVVRLSRDRAAVGIHGDHIAWSSLGDNGVASLTFGRVRW
ncbi:SigE family RNA polymerase sigma factor [Promicromonospora kroppenstedtii]|uniref:SigE family RNA polymerase sigma factor n=1 Tax=Promicromonospora kroppenstedtii TaxID=440482 RepID=UPI0012F878CE|nr:SigE family RNA polymerase sigma factor [Promicromonospora kroppenstedtii]